MTTATLDRPVVTVPELDKPRGLRFARVRRVIRWIAPTEAKVMFLTALAGYLAIGWYLTVTHAVNFGDALVRVSQAADVTLSRSPHLAALGFGYMPLPALMLVPFAPLGHIWPVLLSHGYLGCIESALMGAGSVVVLRGFLCDLRVPALPRWLLIAVFALHPLVLYYAGSGMSEIDSVFFLLVATRSLNSWLEEPGRHGKLLITGLALAAAYLTRLEVIAACVTVTALVGVVTYVRSTGVPKARLRTAGTDCVLVASPWVVAAALWAIISKVIIGQWLFYATSEQFQLHALAGEIFSRGGHTPYARALYVGEQLLGLEPLAFVAIGIALVLVVVPKWDWRPLAPIAVMGSVVAVTTVTFIKGSTFGYLRFNMPIVPLCICCAAYLGQRNALPTGAKLFKRALRLSVATLAGLIAVATAAPALPAAYATMLSHRLAPQEAAPLTALWRPAQATHDDRLAANSFVAERHIAAYLDSLHLPNGSVLTDTSTSFAIVVASHRPKQFIISSDLDFQRAVADPNRFHVRYILVPKLGAGTSDFIVANYPGLYENGAGIATLVKDFPQSGDGFAWRLYKLIPGAAGRGGTLLPNG